MRRTAGVFLSTAMVVAMLANTASATSLTARTDPNDTASTPDIRKVWTDISPRGTLFQIGTWNPLTFRDTSFSVLLDTKGSPEYDRIVEISRTTCVVEKLRDGFLGAALGTRYLHRPNKRAIRCLVPTGWLGIRKTVGFVVVTGIAGGPHHDRAPNARRFYGL